MVILASPKCMNPLPRRHKFLNFGGKFHDYQIRAFSLSPIALEMEVTRFNTYLLYAIVNIIFWFFLTKHLTMPLYVTKWFGKNNHEWTFSSCIFFSYNIMFLIKLYRNDTKQTCFWFPYRNIKEWYEKKTYDLQFVYN